jgi:hypothetical protein
MTNLHQWKNSHFKSIPKEIEKKRKLLEELAQRSDLEGTQQRQNLLTDMDELLYREEMAWMQRSQVSWVKEGDRNTKFSHRQASR